MSELARLSLTINGQTFEISGPESFVSAQIEQFKESIVGVFSGTNTSPTSQENGTQSGLATPSPSVARHATSEPPTFPRVLHVEGEKVRLLKSVPGSTTSKKAVGTAVIYLWAKRAAGVEQVPFSELRELCKNQGCLDQTNFASQMKGARQWIITDGTKGSSAQTCKLTTPGIEHAEELLKSLNGE